MDTGNPVRPDLFAPEIFATDDVVLEEPLISASLS